MNTHAINGATLGSGTPSKNVFVLMAAAAAAVGSLVVVRTTYMAASVTCVASSVANSIRTVFVQCATSATAQCRYGSLRVWAAGAVTAVASWVATPRITWAVKAAGTGLATGAMSYVTGVVVYMQGAVTCVATSISAFARGYTRAPDERQIIVPEENRRVGVQ